MPDPAPPRVLISYAHESPKHMADVERLYKLLRENGVDAQLDLIGDEEPRNWALWMTTEIARAEHVLMIISPSYKRRFESDEPEELGAGVRWEARIIRDAIYRDQAGARRKFLTVLLPGGRREDIPDSLEPGAGSPYQVKDFSFTGAERLIRWLKREPARLPSKLGAIPHRPPGAAAEAEAAYSVGLQLVVTDQDSHVSERIVDAMINAVSERAVTIQPLRLSDGRLAGAFVLIAAEPAAVVIETSIRTVHQHVRAAAESAPSLEARIGLDVESSLPSSVEQVTERLVHSRTARAMHGVKGANLVVTASPAFRSWAIDAKVGFPALRSYREVADRSFPGGTFWIAVPGRSVCPPAPQPPENDDVSSFEDDEGTRAANSRFWFPDNRGVVSIVEQGDHSTVNIGNIRQGESP
jgi:TIR domain